MVLLSFQALQPSIKIYCLLSESLAYTPQLIREFLMLKNEFVILILLGCS